MRAVNANLTPPQLIARIEASATPFPQPTGLPVCPSLATDGSGECACPNDGSQCGTGMVNALSAVKAAQRPIAAIVLPTRLGAGLSGVFDASASAASCGRTIASYAWTGTSGITFGSAQNAAQVTITPGSGTDTLTLTVTDSVGSVDTATVTLTAGTPSSAAPSTAGTAASACPTALTVSPAPPTVSESFSPTSVGENVAATLTISFNNANGFALTQSGFTETLPANLTIQTSPAPTTTCTGASGSLSTSGGTVTLSGANIPSNGSCSVTLSVKSAAAGDYASAISAKALTTGPAGGNSASTTASLTVTAPPSKSGGGALDWLDLMFAVGVLLAGRRQAARRPPG